MDFETRFMITRWAIRGFGLVLMLGVIPSVLFMTLHAWRRLLQAWRTQRPSGSEPVQVEVVMPAPTAMEMEGGNTAALRETLAPTQQLPPRSAPRPALPAPQGGPNIFV